MRRKALITMQLNDFFARVAFRKGSLSAKVPSNDFFNYFEMCADYAVPDWSTLFSPSATRDHQVAFEVTTDTFK